LRLWFRATWQVLGDRWRQRSHVVRFSLSCGRTCQQQSSGNSKLGDKSGVHGFAFNQTKIALAPLLANHPKEPKAG
jgi:hypothetical protein